MKAAVEAWNEVKRRGTCVIERTWLDFMKQNQSLKLRILQEDSKNQSDTLFWHHSPTADYFMQEVRM
jgi:hypothetical protein